MRPVPRHVPCPLCARLHQAVELRRGERALCTACGATLQRRLSGEAALAFATTALLLALPAVQAPLVIVRKFGADHPNYLWTGVRSLWQQGMPLLSVWVALCGALVPLALIGILAGVVASSRLARDGRPSALWRRAAHALQRWSMPEVHVLAILVAFIKIGVLVHVEPGLGLWFYSAMAVATLLAWRNLDLREGEA